MPSKPSKNSGTLTHIVVKTGDAIIHVYCGTPPPRSLLTEARQRLAGVYFYDKHQPHAPPGQYHLHVYLKNNQIFAINWDGTGSMQDHNVLALPAMVNPPDFLKSAEEIT